MICPPCLAAGGINANAIRNEIPMAFKTAARIHARCLGGTWCDCQHATGDEHINRKEVERANLSRRPDARAS